MCDLQNSNITPRDEDREEEEEGRTTPAILVSESDGSREQVPAVSGSVSEPTPVPTRYILSTRILTMLHHS